MFWFFTKFKKCAKNRQKISLNILGLICRIETEKRRPSSFKEYPDEKPYSCTHCSKTFRLKTNLKAYERVHTEDNPFCCKTCNECFINARILKDHV